jgi:hypothetical protein
MEAKVPNYLARQALAVPEREKVSIDEIVALTLSPEVVLKQLAHNAIPGTTPSDDDFVSYPIFEKQY